MVGPRPQIDRAPGVMIETAKLISRFPPKSVHILNAVTPQGDDRANDVNLS
jgi:hypothetical protein